MSIKLIKTARFFFGFKNAFLASLNPKKHSFNFLIYKRRPYIEGNLNLDKENMLILKSHKNSKKAKKKENWKDYSL